jgi:hypothetical protein
VFAQEKLLCAETSDPESLTSAQLYAVLSQRFALDTSMTNFLFHTPNPNGAMKHLHEQIAKHMRVCVTIDDGIETLRGIASSEPILSEAASRIMSSDKFSLHSAIFVVLNKYCINRVDRGELVVAAFFAWARDRVVKIKLIHDVEVVGQLCPHFSVTELFGQLLTKSAYEMMFESKPSVRHVDDSPLPFQTVFKNAMMHFNHLIRPQEQGALGLPFLLHFMARGAAALGANCQPGFDAVYPFLYNGTLLDIDNVGFIIVQVRNSTESESKSGTLDDMFLKMDPFDCILIKPEDDQDGRFLIPIIRIIFLLSDNDNFFKQHTSSINKESPSRFTSYDFVCSGVHSDFLLPTKGMASDWKKLVDQVDDWRSFYDENQPNIRSQLPALAKHEGHYKAWSNKLSLFEGYI